MEKVMEIYIHAEHTFSGKDCKNAFKKNKGE